MKDKEKQIKIKRGELVDLLNQEQEELQKASAIEEMAKDLKEIETDVGHILVNETFSYVKEHKKYNSKKDFSNAHTKTFEELTAEEMFKKGYRKLPENSVVLSREEYNDLILAKKTFASDGEEVSSDTLLSTFKGIKEQARKETAEKIYTKIKDSFLMNSNNRYALKLWIEEQFGLEIKE